MTGSISNVGLELGKMFHWDRPAARLRRQIPMIAAGFAGRTEWFAWSGKANRRSNWLFGGALRQGSVLRPA